VIYGAPRNEWVTSYRAREAFDVAGRLVAKGEVMQERDPLTAIVLKVRPDLLLVSTYLPGRVQPGRRRKET
jgi:hypothetical protein